MFGTQFSEDLALKIFPVSLFQKDSCQLMAINVQLKEYTYNDYRLFQKKVVEETNILLQIL